MPSSRRRLKRKRTTATAVNGSKVRRERDADSKKEDGSKSRRKPLRVWYPDTSRSCLQGTQQAKQRDGLKQTESNKDHPPFPPKNPFTRFACSKSFRAYTGFPLSLAFLFCGWGCLYCLHLVNNCRFFCCRLTILKTGEGGHIIQGVGVVIASDEGKVSERTRRYIQLRTWVQEHRSAPSSFSEGLGGGTSRRMSCP